MNKAPSANTPPATEQAALPCEEVLAITVRWYGTTPNDYLDARNLSRQLRPEIRATEEAERFGDVLYHRCNGQRDGYVYVLATQPPPLPCLFSGTDPRACCALNPGV